MYVTFSSFRDNLVTVDQLNLYHAKPGYILLENSVDPDKLASKKPADQDPLCFLQCSYLESCKLN